MGMMDPGFMKEAMEMMNDPAVMKQVTSTSQCVKGVVYYGGLNNPPPPFPPVTPPLFPPVLLTSHV